MTRQEWLELYRPKTYQRPTDYTFSAAPDEFPSDAHTLADDLTEVMPSEHSTFREPEDNANLFMWLMRAPSKHNKVM